MAYCNFPSSIVSPFSLLILLLLTLFAHSSVYSLPLCHEHERAALLKFRASLIHPSETSKGVEFLESWKGLNCCHWERGKFHYTNSHVLSLYLSGIRGDDTKLGRVYLNATSLTRLQQLSFLGLSFNNLGGELPFKELSKLRNLNFLYLDSNDFEGPIPEEVGLLTSLHELWLDDCRLQGSIPSALDNLHHLKELSLGGAIPSCLGNLSVLSGLNLNRNHLGGSIPHELHNLQSLAVLDLSHNDLWGNFSFSTFSNLSELVEVALSYNPKLTILPSNHTLFQLSFLYMSPCNVSKFYTSIPSFLSTQYILEFADFSNNNIQWRIPPRLLQFTVALD
ncbi:hypothetical protein AMTR_s00023p00179770 [Amborella trichopoda]|uniref:Uncharacterized protein n=1 Tax=Amborella trichopoda TaxID=13333 RepID=W1NKC6_AMBTC|nr:hypothetical protein AMTR_s00023p00179770 [Amborella trichopoda]